MVQSLLKLVVIPADLFHQQWFMQITLKIDNGVVHWDACQMKLGLGVIGAPFTASKPGK